MQQTKKHSKFINNTYTMRELRLEFVGEDLHTRYRRFLQHKKQHTQWISHEEAFERYKLVQLTSFKRLEHVSFITKNMYEGREHANFFYVSYISSENFSNTRPTHTRTIAWSRPQNEIEEIERLSAAGLWWGQSQYIPPYPGSM